MRNPPRSYTREFKERAVALVKQEGQTVTQVARNLGVPYSVLHRWVAEVQTANVSGRPVFTGKGHISLTLQEKRIKDLEREIYILRQERDILKSAAKFFAKEMR